MNMNELHSSINGIEKSFFKRNARRAVNMVAFAAIISMVLTYVFYIAVDLASPFVRELIINIVTKAGQNEFYATLFAEIFLYGEEYNWFISVVSAVLCSFVPFVIISKHMLLMDAADAAPLKGKILGSFPFVYCAALMAANIVSAVADGIFSVVFPDAYKIAASEISEIYGNITSETSLILAFLSMCIVAPFAEEFIYRGVIFGYVKKYGVYFAAFSSSLIFGLAHATVSQIAYTFIFGFVLCMVTYKTGNLKTAILMHFINNLVGYMQAYLLPYLGFEDAVTIFETLYSLIVGIFAVVGLILYFKDNKYSENKADNENNAPISCFFGIGTVLVIVFSIINVVLGIFANG